MDPILSDYLEYARQSGLVPGTTIYNRRKSLERLAAGRRGADGPPRSPVDQGLRRDQPGQDGRDRRGAPGPGPPVGGLRMCFTITQNEA
jgi:hypothetical protein